MRIHDLQGLATPVQANKNMASFFRDKAHLRNLLDIDHEIEDGYQKMNAIANHYAERFHAKHYMCNYVKND